MVRPRQLTAALLLCAAMVLTAGCGSENELPADTTAPTETTAPAPAARQIMLVDNHFTPYTIMRPEQADKSIVNAAVAMMHAFTSQLGATPQIADDWSRDIKRGETAPVNPELCQILIGETNRGETAVVRDAIDFALGYRITWVGSSLVLYGTNDAMTRKAVEDFTAEYLVKGDSLALPEDFEMTYNFAADTKTGAGIMGKYRVLGSTLKSSFGANATAVVKTALFHDDLGTANVTPAIIVGENENFPSSVTLARELGYLDYTIKVSPEEILIGGGSPLSTWRAADRFAELFTADAIGSPTDGFTETWRFAEARPDSLIYHLDAFTPGWAADYTVPAWLTDFDEKAYAITAPTGRYVTDSHRGDSTRYPENSLEGIYSALLLGADMIEIDIRLTADHVPVLMHDASLDRTTDVESKMGQNGLPKSNLVEDWTYAQLLELNLELDGQATDCKIPTAYEAVALCAGRCFVHWDCKAEGFERDTDVYLLAEDLGPMAKASFYFYYGQSVMNTWYTKNKADTEFGDFCRTMTRYLAMADHKLARRNFDTISTNGDHATGWKRTVETDGYRCVFTNEIEAISKFIAQNQSPQTIPQ